MHCITASQTELQLETTVKLQHTVISVPYKAALRWFKGSMLRLFGRDIAFEQNKNVINCILIDTAATGNENVEYWSLDDNSAC